MNAILEGATKYSIKKLIVTSAGFCIMDEKRGEDIFTELDYNQISKKTSPYAKSKIL